MSDDPSGVRILRVLAATPGASTRLIARSVHLHDSTATYHLRKLKKQGHVDVGRHGREVVWFHRATRVCPLVRASLAGLRRPQVAILLQRLDERPRSVPELARRTGLSEGATRWAAERLGALGFVARSPAGRIALAPGMGHCAAKALAGAHCPLWGTCEPSRNADTSTRCGFSQGIKRPS